MRSRESIATFILFVLVSRDFDECGVLEMQMGAYSLTLLTFYAPTPRVEGIKQLCSARLTSVCMTSVCRVHRT